MWLSAIKLALNAGTHIYKKKQETKRKTYKTEISRKQRKQIEEEGPIPSAHLTLSITFHTQYSKTITLERDDAALVFHPSLG